jgi:hypothetical protein
MEIYLERIRDLLARVFVSFDRFSRSKKRFSTKRQPTNSRGEE